MALRLGRTFFRSCKQETTTGPGDKFQLYGSDVVSSLVLEFGEKHQVDALSISARPGRANLRSALTMSFWGSLPAGGSPLPLPQSLPASRPEMKAKKQIFPAGGKNFLLLPAIKKSFIKI